MWSVYFKLIGDNITLNGVQFENDGVYETANYVVVSKLKIR